MSELDGLWRDGGVGEIPGIDNPHKMRAVKPPPPAPPLPHRMDPAVLAELEHEVLDTSPIQWAEEAAAKVTA